MNCKTSASWIFDSNWVIAHGFPQASVTVESSDYPIDEPDLETVAHKSPLVLKPTMPDSGPCEITICFDKKYDISQIYVRSTARVYEVYYADSPHSTNEYLCTVKCGVAERDGIILQTSSIKVAGVKHSEECLSGEITEVSVADGEANVSSEDEWVNIKVPEVESNCVSDKVNTSRMENIQDLYEATAHISDADPCSVLKIRLLSLQDNSNAYVDEIYVFVDPVVSTGNETVLAGSSTPSTLMAMLVPTLLQLSRSGACQVQDKHASLGGFKDATDIVYKDNKIENVSIRNDETEINQGNENYVKPKEHEKDIKEDPVNTKDSPPGCLEKALDQLISRVGRVEDICLRFEEKLMKPIESIEARLQKVEDQLKKLTDNTNHYTLPHGIRIGATTCQYSSEQTDFPTLGASELENEDLLCNNTTKLLGNANLQPSLIVSAPEFPCEEDEEDFKQVIEYPHAKALSVDDALAAALNGFLSSARSHPSDNVPAASAFSGNTREHSGSITIVQEFDSLQHGQGFTRRIPNPKLTEDTSSNDEYMNYTQVSLPNNDELDLGDFGKSMRIECSIGHHAAVEETKGDSDSDSDNDFSLVKTCIDAMPDVGSVDAGRNRTNGIPGRTIDSDPNDNDGMISKLAQGHASEDPKEHDNNGCETSSSSSALDFEFPILEVKFKSDISAITKIPLEALLGGAKNSDTKVLSFTDGSNDDRNLELINGIVFNGNETTDFLPMDLCIDTGVLSAAYGSPGESECLLCAPSGRNMDASLI